MEQFATGLIVSIAIVFSLGSRARARAWAVAGTLLMVLLVDTELTGQTRHWAVAGIAFMNGLAALRSGGLRAPSKWVLCLFVWMNMVDFINRPSVNTLLLGTVGAAAVVLFAGNVQQLGRTAVSVMGRVAVVVLLINCASGVSERFMGRDAPWPRRDGITFRVDGVNNIWPAAGGRALGTMSWAITLGEAAAILVILSIGIFWTRKRTRWLMVAACGVLIIFLSGTRTALIMLLAAAAVYVLSRTRRLVIVIPVVVLCTLIVAQSTADIASVLGFGADSADTASVEHRQAVWAAVPHIVSDRSLPDFLFGTGYSSATNLFHSGFISNAGSVTVYDNEVVHTLVGAGLVGLVLLIAAASGVLRRGGVLACALVVASLVGALSYDIFTWNALTYLLAAILALRDGDDESDSLRVSARERLEPEKTIGLAPLPIKATSTVAKSYPLHAKSEDSRRRYSDGDGLGN